MTRSRTAALGLLVTLVLLSACAPAAGQSVAPAGSTGAAGSAAAPAGDAKP
jgi:hypothetical protein